MAQSRYCNTSWFRYILVSALISVMTGAFSFFSQGDWWITDFWTMQVYSFCIVFSVLAFYTMLRLFIPQAKSSFILRIAILMPALAVGYESGMAIAAHLYGQPVTLGALVRMSRTEQLIFITSTIFMIYLLWSHRRIADAAAARAAALQLATEVQLRLLQAQLEPHMLFNTLANLHSLIEVDTDRAQLMVEHLIEFMRCTLSASRKETASLEDEFGMIAVYLKLMEIRMGSRLSFDLVLPDSLAQACVPTMLLQPLVENAIKHGLEPKVEGGTIRIEAVEDGKFLQVSVCDTGIGLSANMSEERYGITHVQERLRILYGDGASLSVRGMPAGGVVATVKMPL